MNILGGTHVRRGRWTALIAVLLVAHGCLPFSIFPPSLPERSRIYRIERLSDGWQDSQRNWFHHVTQGTATPFIPYEWFMALEQPSLFEQPLFSDPDYLERFGFLPSPKGADGNPDGLPIGLARREDVFDPLTGETFNGFGLTCSACHTGQIEYKGTAIRIEGGASGLDLGRFRHALSLALGFTKYVPFRFSRFADRVLGPSHTDRQRDELEAALDKAVTAGLDSPELEEDILAASTEEGFMRLDALGRITNYLFGVGLDPKNMAPLVAPVNFPPIWNTHWFNWVQYNGSVRQPMMRNASEALGVYARVDLIGPPETRFRSSVDIRNLFEIEQLLAGPAWGSGLRSPRWPEHVLGEIDKKKAGHGAVLYRELCQHCHLPPLGSAELLADEYWEEPNEVGQRYLKLNQIPIDVVGTDPNQALTMTQRKIYAATASISAGDWGGAVGAVSDRVTERWYNEQKISPEERARMNGYRKSLARAELAYRPRPLNGVWATPPYLHNGSVPNLYLLLSPVEERPSSFYLGNREFDPVHVGYEYGPFEGGFELTVAENCAAAAQSDGNCNSGHEFREGGARKGVIGRALTVEERWALVEYLKTL